MHDHNKNFMEQINSINPINPINSINSINSINPINSINLINSINPTKQINKIKLNSNIDLNMNMDSKYIAIIENVHSILKLGSITQFGDIIKKLVVNSKKRVLLVCDIDGTLINPQVTIGTDPWFINSLNDDNINNVRKKLGLIYSLLDFKGVEDKNTDEFVDLIQKLSTSHIIFNHVPLTYICMTARNTTLYSHTVIHFNDSGSKYVKTFIRPNMLHINDALCIITDHMDHADYTDNTYHELPHVRYIDNICFCSGTNKGDVLIELLNRYYDEFPDDKFDVIIFIDDSITNVSNVHNKLKNYLDDASSICVHYNYLEEHHNSYTIHDFMDDTKKLNELLEFKQYINTPNEIN